MPCTKTTFLASLSSLPHSYTLKVPYGLTTSLAPGKASGGYGSWPICEAVREGMTVLRGEGIGALLGVGRQVW